MKRVFAIIALIASSVSPAQDTEFFNVPASSVSLAINIWSRQSGMQVLFDHAEISKFRSHTLHGRYEIMEGLKRILMDSPLKVEDVNERTIAVTYDPGPTICKPWMGAEAPLPPCVQGT